MPAVLLFPLPALRHHSQRPPGHPQPANRQEHVTCPRKADQSPNRPATTPPAVLTGLAVITGIDLARPTELGGSPSGANGILHRLIDRPANSR